MERNDPRFELDVDAMADTIVLWLAYYWPIATERRLDLADVRNALLAHLENCALFLEPGFVVRTHAHGGAVGLHCHGAPSADHIEITTEADGATTWIVRRSRAPHSASSGSPCLRVSKIAAGRARGKILYAA